MKKRGRPFRSSIRRTWRKEMFEAQSGLCHWCKRTMLLYLPNGGKVPTNDYATFEHLHPARAGGKWTRQNIVLACWECNKARGDKISAPEVTA